MFSLVSENRTFREQAGGVTITTRRASLPCLGNLASEQDGSPRAGGQVGGPVEVPLRLLSLAATCHSGSCGPVIFLSASQVTSPMWHLIVVERDVCFARQIPNF